jgi:hypothetical protein
MKRILILITTAALPFSFCAQTFTNGSSQPAQQPVVADDPNSTYGKDYTSPYLEVPLTTDVSKLTEEEKAVLSLLIDAARLADDIFLVQSGGKQYEMMFQRIAEPGMRERFKINYGPWDRLNGDAAFMKKIPAKPAGAGFYPADMTKEEFEKWDDPNARSPYTMITRGPKGFLQATYYHQAFSEQVNQMVNILNKAAITTTDPQLSLYLKERAMALRSDSYGASDVAWLQMRKNHLDIIIGPIENYEDKLYGLKTSYEAYVLVKDMEWSERLDKYAALLPKLQQQLPAPKEIKMQPVGSDSQLAAYDVVFYAGDCNSGSKTIAVNLPNDETIQQKYGTRRSQLKNTMRAKYDHILVPIASELIADEQIQHITFDAFFSNVMFHEVAHGLGVKNSKNGMTVRENLKEQSSWLEEEKADVLGLWLIGELYEMGEMEKGDMMDHYVTFLAGIFRSCRFGASSAHGVANMHTFNFLEGMGAFQKNIKTGKYTVNETAMRKGIQLLAEKILALQFEGDYDKVTTERKNSEMSPQLQANLAAISAKGIPVDLVFRQGQDVLFSGNK